MAYAIQMARAIHWGTEIHLADEKRMVNETHWGHKKQSADVI